MGFELPIKNIPVLSRNTKGVILMRFKSDEDKLNAMTIIDQANQIEETKPDSIKKDSKSPIKTAKV